MLSHHSFRAATVLGLYGLMTGSVLAQPMPPDDKQPNGIEVLARGPVHEAFALPADQQAGPGPVAPRKPPEPIDELPPDQKPDGDNVQWCPGYWSWDDERKDFVWVSGFWRMPPPNRSWVPGGWQKAGEGWQWVGGFWGQAAQGAPGAKPEAQYDYLPEPPAPVEAGPSTPAPADDSVYVPGSWVYRDRYAWRPGYWVDHRPGWVWTPACYRWTPAGHVFVDGFWDYPLADRGVLFAPVCIAPDVYGAAGFAYTPSFVVREPCLFGALFVRRGFGSYYFGDYFGRGYAGAGFTPWCGGQLNVGFGVNRGFHDPLFNYYRAANRGNPQWGRGIGDLYAGRFNGSVAAPPRTLIQQTTVVNSFTSNKTVVNNTTINNVQMLSPLRDVRSADRPLAAVNTDARRQFADNARQTRDVGQQRRQIETQLMARGPEPKGSLTPRTAKLPLTQQVVAREQPSKSGTGPSPRPRLDVPSGPPRAALTHPGRRENPDNRPTPAFVKPDAGGRDVRPAGPGNGPQVRPETRQANPVLSPPQPRNNPGQQPNRVPTPPRAEAPQPQPRVNPVAPRSERPQPQPSPMPVPQNRPPAVQNPSPPKPRDFPTPPKLNPVVPQVAQPQPRPIQPTRPTVNPQLARVAPPAGPNPATLSRPVPSPQAPRVNPTQQAPVTQPRAPIPTPAPTPVRPAPAAQIRPTPQPSPQRQPMPARVAQPAPARITQPAPARIAPPPARVAQPTPSRVAQPAPPRIAQPPRSSGPIPQSKGGGGNGKR